MRNVSDKNTREIKTHILCSVNFSSKNRAVYEIMWENIVQPDRLQVAIWRIAVWIPNATNTHSQYVILIVFPLQQSLQQSTSNLPYTYRSLLVWLWSEP
jgi:hypothetical protein